MLRKIIYSLIFVILLIVMIRFMPFILVGIVIYFLYKRLCVKKSVDNIRENSNTKIKDMDGMDMALHISKRNSEFK